MPFEQILDQFKKIACPKPALRIIENPVPSFPVVSVLDVTDQKDLLSGDLGSIQLGVGAENIMTIEASLAEVHVQNFIQAWADVADHAVILTWKGNKIPRGVDLFGHIIHTTQNGEVRDATGRTFGYYDRLIEFGGGEKQDQAMLVFIPPA